MKDDLTIGIDLGGTQLRVALVDDEGQVVKRSATRTDVPGGPEAVIRQMLALVSDITTDKRANVRAVGICSPGPLDSDTGTIIDIPSMPSFINVPLRDTLARALNLPVSLENDAQTAAYGEWKHGAGQGLNHLVYITVSTGIGGGVIADGKLLRGRRGMASHIGHLMIDPHGPRCDCGGTGCIEAMACGTVFSRLAREQGFVDGAAATEAARKGDSTALALLQHEAEILGYGFATLLHLYSPERLIIGGGLSSALDLMLPAIRQQIERHAMPAFRDVDIVRAALGDNAGLVGAAAIAREAFSR